jgi:hypothetical protein
MITFVQLNPPRLNHLPPQFRAPRQLALHDRPVLAPRRGEYVAHKKVQAEPRELPGAIGRERHGAHDTPPGAGVNVQKGIRKHNGRGDESSERYSIT